jgi:hypothetical protein
MVYFIMLRYVNAAINTVYPVMADDDYVALFDSEECANSWIEQSSICNSGQVIAKVYEAPMI